jgi:hypothetical protein
MTKKVAVVGCSFSAFWQGDESKSGLNYDVKTWSHQLVENYDVTIDSFAMNGASAGHVNYCLSYILNNPELEYDLVIGNMPPLNRDWYFAWNKADELTDFNNLGDLSRWFSSYEEQERVRIYEVEPVTVCHSHDKITGLQGSKIKGLTHYEHEYVKNQHEHIANNYMVNHRKNLHYVQMAREYYTQVLPFTFWYHASNAFTDKYINFELATVDFRYLARHSIVHEDHVKAFFRNMFPLSEEKAEFESRYLVDSSHFSTYGHEQLLEKYILTDNKINSILIS